MDAIKDWLTVAAALLAAVAGSVGSAFVTVRWVLRKEFATHASMLQVADALKDTATDLQRQIDEQRHAHALLEKDVANLPSFRQIDGLKEDVGELKQGQAVSREKLDALKEGMEQLRISFERLGEDLRKAAHR